MIQVSNPIMFTQESSEGKLPKNTGAEKKEPLGVFAKILAGLLKKTHKDPAGAGGKAETGEIPEKTPAGAGEKISSRNRKKSSPVPEEGEAGAALWFSPEGTPLTGQRALPEDSGLLVQTGLLPEEEGTSQGPSPVSAGFTGNGEGEGDKAPPFTGTTWTDLPGEGAEIKAAADAAVPLEETTPDLKGEQTDGLRDRKPAGKTGLQTAAGPAAGGSGNAETLSVSWEGVKNFPTVKPEKEAPRENRVAEGRTRDRRRERLGLEVRDLRTLPSQPASELPLSVSGRTARGEAELLVELPAAGEDSSGERSSPETGGSRESFESLLARELRQDLSGDIVRSAQVILRDGGEGIIRLSLKPESLGNVKIRLEMAENKITGHIIVENDETLKAFEQELHSLEQAFLDAGFDGADLDTALASGNGQNGAGGERDRGEGDFFIPRQLAAAAYNALPEGGEEAGAGGNFGYGISQQINMLI